MVYFLLTGSHKWVCWIEGAGSTGTWWTDRGDQWAITQGVCHPNNRVLIEKIVGIDYTSKSWYLAMLVSNAVIL